MLNHSRRRRCFAEGACVILPITAEFFLVLPSSPPPRSCECSFFSPLGEECCGPSRRSQRRGASRLGWSSQTEKSEEGGDTAGEEDDPAAPRAHGHTLALLTPLPCLVQQHTEPDPASSPPPSSSSSLRSFWGSVSSSLKELSGSHRRRRLGPGRGSCPASRLASPKSARFLQ